jgi:hypothetical protein
MRSNRSVATFMISGLLALTTPFFVNPHKADANDYSENQCRKSVVGTYLSTVTQTNTNSGQPTSYREIITFTAEGNLIANDSTAGGVPGSSNPADQPFGPIQGTWKCVGNNKIVAKVLNFGFLSGSLPSYIAVTEYQLSFNPRTRTVNGSVTYDLFDLNSNPLDPNTQPLPGGPFEFNYSGGQLTLNQK